MRSMTHLGVRTPGSVNHLRQGVTVPGPVRRPFRGLPAVAAFALAVLAVLAVLCLVPTARGQQGNQTPTIISSGNVPPGVYIDADGTVRRRQIDASKELADMRARAKAAVAV